MFRYFTNCAFLGSCLDFPIHLRYNLSRVRAEFIRFMDIQGSLIMRFCGIFAVSMGAQVEITEFNNE